MESTTIANTAAEIGARYFPDRICFEELDEVRVQQAIESKSSAYWQAGQKIEDGWVTLAFYSGFRGNPGAVSVCREDLFNRVKESLNDQ